MSSIEIWQLRQRQALPLEMKEKYTEKRIRDWYDHFDGNVFVSFSGGKDSTVLLHQVRKIYPDIPAVFCDTGLEYPEIREFVKTIENVIWMRPRIPFTEVLTKYGYPVVSKRVARGVHDLKNATDKNLNVCNLRRTGLNRKGVYCPSQKLPNKWLMLEQAPFKISDHCCDVMKKEPIHRYQKETKKMPITGVMAYESSRREKQYLQQGCNAYESKTNPISMPIAFWLEQDIWDYIKKYNIPYSKIYDMGEVRTGCIFCMFGVHLEKEPNRFQRLKLTHPKLYDYCINKLNIKQCLDYIKVSY